MFGGQVTNASLLKLQQNRQKEEARRSVRENKDADDDGGEFRGPDPGFDENFVSQNVSLKKRELEGLSLTPMQLLELQRKEDEIAENGPGELQSDSSSEEKRQRRRLGGTSVTPPWWKNEANGHWESSLRP